MPKKTGKIADFKVSELRKFAGDVLGITFPFGVSTEQARATVRQATGTDEISIEVDEANTEAKPAEVPPVVGRRSSALDSPPADEGSTRILIHGQDTPGGQEPVQVSVNGRAMLIPRGKPVLVRNSYVEVLKNAVATRYEEVRGEEGEMTMVPVDYPSIPFSLA